MTTHQILTMNSNSMHGIKDKSIHLIVTSPPYPMIEMWDPIFSTQDASVMADLSRNGISAYHKMHSILNAVWEECDRVLADNGFACINIGDATRTIHGEFQLYSNHTQVINKFLDMGYYVLPDIHWRKKSNAPNKYMGSGMYPAGAYVTYEHEYILIFRKGGKRTFNGFSKALRQKSAFFWEERNLWFSDLWEIKGANQSMKSDLVSRKRTASFPFEIPYRLINMYAAEGDTVLDPFVGLGTTNLAAIASNRNSIGIDIDADISNLAIDNLNVDKNALNSIIDKRIASHRDFIKSLREEKRQQCYLNCQHDFLVKTKQETAIKIDHIKDYSLEGNVAICEYE